MRRRATSLRLRLTLSYGVVFFAVGVILLAVSYLLVRHFLINDPDDVGSHVASDLQLTAGFLRERMPSQTGGQQVVGVFVRAVQDSVVMHVLQRLPFFTFLALGLAAIVSVGLGWLVSGRMLRPVQEMATVARRLSASTLHERIALQGPHDELHDLADSFDAMLTRLEKAFASQREFVANASHELRTPLTIMHTDLEVTLDDRDATVQDLREMADRLRGAIGRSEDVIDKLLTLAESGDLGEKRPVDLASLAEASVGRAGQKAAARRLTFAVRGRAAPAVVEGDEALLERLVDNLVENAISYASEGTEIRLDIGATGGRASLTITNDGDVIDPAEVPRLFERFYRRESSRGRDTGGSGLGMAIVVAVAEAHGGTVAAESLSRGGLSVRVTLPLLGRPARDGAALASGTTRPQGRQAAGDSDGREPHDEPGPPGGGDGDDVA